MDFEQEFKDYVFMLLANDKKHYDFVNETIEKCGNTYEAEKIIKGYILSKPKLIKDIAEFTVRSFSYKKQMEEF